MYNVFVGAILNVIADFPLRHLVNFGSLEIHVKWFHFLASRPNQNLDIYTKHARLYGQLELEVPSASDTGTTSTYPCPSTKTTARSLTLQAGTRWLDSPSGLSNFFSNPFTMELDVAPILEDRIYKAFVLSGCPTLAHIRSLTIFSINHDQLKLLKAMPNLMKLTFLGRCQL